jgi:hypothetical protein
MNEPHAFGDVESHASEVNHVDAHAGSGRMLHNGRFKPVSEKPIGERGASKIRAANQSGPDATPLGRKRPLALMRSWLPQVLHIMQMFFDHR